MVIAYGAIAMGGDTRLRILYFAGLSRAGTLATTDAAAPALQRIERASIAASTAITYPPDELLLLIEVRAC